MTTGRDKAKGDHHINEQQHNSDVSQIIMVSTEVPSMLSMTRGRPSSQPRMRTNLLVRFICMVVTLLCVCNATTNCAVFGQEVEDAGGSASSSSLSSSSPSSVGNKLPLQPFQIKVEYDDSIMNSNNNGVMESPSSVMARRSEDEMMILSSTQTYLSESLSLSLPNFSYLMLYQYVRDYVVNTGGGTINGDHYSKIAMNGVVYFTEDGGNIGEDGSSIPPTPDEIQVLLLQNLLGDNITKYIDVLHGNGMANVVNATLLSIEGNELVYRDGQIAENNPISSDSATAGADGGGTTTIIPTVNTMDMDDDMMRRMTLMLCLLIPGVFIFIAATVFCCRSAREINWCPARRKAENDLVWQTSQHMPDDDDVNDAVKMQRVDSISSTVMATV